MTLSRGKNKIASPRKILRGKAGFKISNGNNILRGRSGNAFLEAAQLGTAGKVQRESEN